jgi:tetratricopeptide (TPR) repeat protein
VLPPQRNSLTPVLATALLVLGGCATQQGERLPWRIEPVQTVTHGLGASAGGYYAVGRQIERTRDWPRAADAYRQALRLDPAHVDARNALAVLLARLGLMPDAEAQLRLALQHAPQRADLHSNLGYLLLLVGRPQEAQAALRNALALDPRDGVAQANLELAQGRVAASTVPGSGPVDAAATAGKAAATKSAAVAVPAAAAPPEATALAALQVFNGATVAALATADGGRVHTAAVAADIAATALADATAAVPGGAIRPVVAQPGDTGAAPAAPTAPNASAAPAAFTLELSNGLGRRGAALALRQQLQQRGIAVQRTSNLPPYRQSHTVVLYRPGQEAAARQVARALPLSVPLQPDAAQRAGVRVLLGRDWPAEAAAPLRVAAGAGRE